MTRPGLPPGPFLVVGMARSGVAALTALRARGADAQGVDAGSPPVDLPGVHLRSDGAKWCRGCDQAFFPTLPEWVLDRVAAA